VFIKDKEIEYVKVHEIDFLISSENTFLSPEDSRKIVGNIINFLENKVSRVMMPISEVFAIDIELPEEIIKRIIDNRYSRVPVYKGNINVVSCCCVENSEVIVLDKAGVFCSRKCKKVRY
jgi:CBS domain containing-hemolysin-like protein